MAWLLLSPRSASNELPKQSEISASIMPLTAHEHYKWQTDSPVTVINYYSIDCPHCREIFLEESLYRKLYESTFSLVYRPSPLPDVQPLSLDKAVMAECVFRQSGDEGMFSFLTDVFTQYQTLHTDNEWVETLALAHVVDRESFTECRTGVGRDTVIKQTKQALADGVYGTPTLVVMRGNEVVLRLDRSSSRTVLNTLNSLRRF